LVRIHLGLAWWAFALFCAEGVLGFVSAGRPGLFKAHFIGGVGVALLVCALHVVVMFHFIGSGAELKDLARLLGGDAGIVRATVRFKARVFPFSTLSILTVIAAEVAGGAVHSRFAPQVLHQGLVALAFLLVSATLWLEHQTLVLNERLIDEVNDRIKELMTPAFLKTVGKEG
jgi:hypothetical protein